MCPGSAAPYATRWWRPTASATSASRSSATSCSSSRVRKLARLHTYAYTQLTSYSLRRVSHTYCTDQLQYYLLLRCLTQDALEPVQLHLPVRVSHEACTQYLRMRPL